MRAGACKAWPVLPLAGERGSALLSRLRRLLAPSLPLPLPLAAAPVSIPILTLTRSASQRLLLAADGAAGAEGVCPTRATHHNTQLIC